MDPKDLIKLLKGETLADQEDQGYISTGSYAINYVITKDPNKGFPISKITQILGDTAGGKTGIAVKGLAEAQRLGYHTLFCDLEKAFNKKFAETQGVDPEKLIFTDDPITLEEGFDWIVNTVKVIRKHDPDTPIMAVYDSIGQAPANFEIYDDKGETKEFSESTNMDGARRAKAAGTYLRKIVSFFKENKVCLVIINQLRVDVGVMYGDNRKAAGGGSGLPFCCSVILQVGKPKPIDKSQKDSVGVVNTIKCEKNKISSPYRQTEYRFLYDSGLDPLCGILNVLEAEKLISKNGGWYTISATGDKFQANSFYENFTSDVKFQQLVNSLIKEN